MFVFFCIFAAIELFVAEPLKSADEDIAIQAHKAATSYIDQLTEKARQWEDRVYLATFPRSGNHWMRYLIEEATHIATSSVYQDQDPPHLPNIFSWGGYCCQGGYDGSCQYPSLYESVVVKTHYPSMIKTPFDDLPYKTTIRIIRHPIDAFFSTHAWEKEHVDFKIPNDHLQLYIGSWMVFQTYWNNAPNVITIRYEDLCENPHYYLSMVLQACGYDATKQDINRAIAKYPPVIDFFKHLSHYDSKELQSIQNRIGPLMQLYGYGITSIGQMPGENYYE